MKSLFFSFLVFILCSQILNAQNYFNKGTYNISGSISYMSSSIEYYSGTVNDERFTFAPIGSYFLFDKLSTGVEIEYNYYNTSELDFLVYPKYHNTLSLGPIIRYYLLNKRLSPFAEIGYSFIINDLDYTAEDIKQKGYNVQVGLGINYFFTDNFAIEPSASYEYQSTKRMFVVEGNYEKKYMNKKNILIEIKLNYFIH